MQIDIKRNEISGLNVKGYGRLDLDNAVEFGTTVKDIIEDEEITELILDFSEITFISSFGLKVVLELYKIMKEQGKMKIVKTPEQIEKSFRMVGFNKFLEIE